MGEAKTNSILQTPGVLVTASTAIGAGAGFIVAGPVGAYVGAQTGAAIGFKVGMYNKVQDVFSESVSDVKKGLAFLGIEITEDVKKTTQLMRDEGEKTSQAIRNDCEKTTEMMRNECRNTITAFRDEIIDTAKEGKKICLGRLEKAIDIAATISLIFQGLQGCLFLAKTMHSSFVTDCEGSHKNLYCTGIDAGSFIVVGFGVFSLISSGFMVKKLLSNFNNIIQKP